jgi:predicted N-acetyltransferase YhbS
VALSTQIYYADTLPPSLTWQALSFLRCEWPFLFTGTNRLLARPFGGPDTTYVVQSDDEVLLSYAEVLQVTAARDGEPVQVLGLSNVFTFPPYRNEGHASAIMRGLGEVINGSDAELGILFCEKELAPFYAARGWQLAPAGSIQAPGTPPRTMVHAGVVQEAQVAGWLAAAPLVLAARW